MRYSALGNVTSMVGRQDPILVHSTAAANRIMSAITALPQPRRISEMNRMLDELEPGLSTKVRKISNIIGPATNASSNAALKEALRLALADWALDYFKKVGSRRGISGLGANIGTTLQNIGQGLTCGIASSDEARALAQRLAGGAQTTGGMATSTGFDVTRRICPGGTPATPSPEYTPTTTTSSIPWVPILIGGTLLVGLVVFVKMRS